MSSAPAVRPAPAAAGTDREVVHPGLVGQAAHLDQTVLLVQWEDAALYGQGQPYGA